MKKTWQFLLKRDFKTEINTDPRKEYFGNVLKKLACKYNNLALELDKNNVLPPSMEEINLLYDIINLKALALSALGCDDSYGTANIMGAPVKNNIFGNIVGDKLIEDLIDIMQNLQIPNPTLIDALIHKTYG